MEIVLAIFLIIAGGLLAWGGFSGNLPGMIKALA